MLSARLFPGTLLIPSSYNLYRVLLPMILPSQLLPFGRSPAFWAVDTVAGLNVNHRKCCWDQHGSDRCEELLDWVPTNW